VVQGVDLAVDLDVNGTIIHEELVLFLESRESLLDDTGIVGVLDVDADHLREELQRIIVSGSYSSPDAVETLAGG
jgi:hypothetical protein